MVKAIELPDPFVGKGAPPMTPEEAERIRKLQADVGKLSQKRLVEINANRAKADAITPDISTVLVGSSNR